VLGSHCLAAGRADSCRAPVDCLVLLAGVLVDEVAGTHEREGERRADEGERRLRKDVTVTSSSWQTEEFERHRQHLRAVAYRADSRGRPLAGGDARRTRGGARWALQRGAPFARYGRAAIVNGAWGVVVATPRRPIAAIGLTVVGGRIVEIDVVADPAKLQRLPVDA
jgi:hypothetical protein